MKKEELTKQALEILGDKAMVIAMEELAELQQAISKAVRGKMRYDNMCEEMADVLIIMDWVREKYGIPELEVESWKKYKQTRIAKRIEANELD